MPDRKKVIGLNGSPRKKWNTATLIAKALEGALSKGAETRLIHLYDLEFKGCLSCFACKTRGGKSYGRCAVKDDLMPVFKEVEEADAVVLGSPIYFGAVTGEMRSFLERWMFPYLTYTNPPRTLFPGRLRTAFIYTMNMADEELKSRGMYEIYYSHFDMNQGYFSRIFGHSAYQLSMDTLQFEDYSEVVADRWKPEDKAKSREERFPVDCEKAFELGAGLLQEATGVRS
ncbi:MAG: flavodoxin family protein [bacterium]|nr:flavodoxin family protein [bacterium]MDT8365139.1 flavodoxin family protein [bacterium]